VHVAANARKPATGQIRRGQIRNSCGKPFLNGSTRPLQCRQPALGPPVSFKCGEYRYRPAAVLVMHPSYSGGEKIMSDASLPHIGSRVWRL